MKRNYLLFCALQCLLAYLLVGKVFAECEDCKLIDVGFTGTLCADSPFTIAMESEGPNGRTIVTAEGSAVGCGYSALTSAGAKVKYFESYSLMVTAAKSSSAHIVLKAPNCTRLFINGEEKTTVDLSNPNGCQQLDGSWSIMVKPVATGGGAGTGGNGGGSVHSIHWDFSMGGLPNGMSASSIQLVEGDITSTSYTTAALRYGAPSPEVLVIRDGAGALRQVKAPEVLADLVTINPQKYEIRYYTPANAGVPTGGFYQPTGNPFAVWTVENPATVPNQQLRITQTRDGASAAYDFVHDPVTGEWSLSEGGLRSVSRVSVTLGNGDRQVTTTVKNPTTGVISSKSRETRHTFPWGEEVVSAIQDPDGSALTTTSVYNEDVAHPNSYSKRKWTIQADGSWERFVYDDYGAGNLTYVLRPWKDSPATPDQANSSNCHATYYSYGSPDYSYFPTEITGETEYVLGTQVSGKQYYTYSTTFNNLPAKYRSEYVYGSSGTIRESADTITYKNTAPQPYTNQLAQVVYDDGRQESYYYELGTFDSTAGVFTSGGAGLYVQQTIIHGTSASPNGLANKSTRTITVRDPGGRVLLEQEQIYTGSAYVPLPATRSFYDSEGRLFQKKLTTGRILYEAVWPAPRQQTVTDETGQTVAFTYDALGRVVTEVRTGITTTYGYDADGRVLSTVRSAGSLSLTSSKAYDLAGRIITQTGEDGLNVSTGYSGGSRIKTRIQPSSGTEITENYLDGQPKSIIGTAVVSRYYDYGGNYGSRWSKESIGSPTSVRWTTTTTDAAGSPILAEQPGFAGTMQMAFAYDESGRLIKKWTGSEAAEVTTYDELGRVSRIGSDADDTGDLEAASSDRIEENESFYEQEDGEWFHVSKQTRYESYGSGVPSILTIRKEQLTGLAANIISKSLLIDRYGQTTTGIVTVDRNTQTVTETTDTPDSNLDIVRTYINKFLKSATTATVAAPTLYDYDSLGREQKITGSRGVERTTGYDAQGRIASSTLAGKTTTFDYYPSGTAGAGKLKSTLYPDGKRVYHSYNLRDEEIRIWGSGAYPTEVVYDLYGQYKELHTFRGGSGWDGATFPTSTGTADISTWNYQEASGLLISQTDAKGRTINYTYNAGGKIESRVWARGVSTRYYYDWLGDVSWKDYSDATPDVAYGHDRAGRLNFVTDASGTHTYSFTDVQRNETISGEGILSGLTLTESLDGFGRRSAFTTALPGANGWTQTTGYTYNNHSQLQNVGSGGGTATYGYLPNSNLLETTTLGNGVQFLVTTRTWNTSNRLRTIANAWSAANQNFDTTTFDNSDRRKQIVRSDGSRWDYDYNDHGEMTFASRKWSDGANVSGQQEAYSYDMVGNRISATTNGRTAVYTPNALDQLDERTVPGAVDVLGTASQDTTVKVNTLPASRHEEYFYKELPVSNSAASVLFPTQVEATAASGTTNRQGQIFVPQTPEDFLYDLDGNLLSDGHWIYAWDGENRLAGMETLASVPTDAKRKLAFAYDTQGRRVRKQVWHWNASQNQWLLYSTFRFAYDGKKLIAELADTGRRIRTYVWGLDLSGTLSAAGGVGGLLFEQDHFAGNTFAVAYDLNGNVTALINTGSGTADVLYEYGPFGEPIRSSGELAKVNPIRWSTKYADEETGLVYYGARYYQPSTGRWLSRDPSGEQEGVNLYVFAWNNPSTWIDTFGEQAVEEPPPEEPPVFEPAPVRPGRPGGSRPAPRPRTGPRPLDPDSPDAPPGGGTDTDDDPFERFVLTASTPQDKARDCGNFESIIDWTLTPFARKGGSVIQTVTIKDERWDCVTKEKKTVDISYTEGWRINTIPAFIKPGTPAPNTFDPYASDVFGINKDGNCTYGIVTFEASAAFYHGYGLPATWGTSENEPWGNVPGTSGTATLPLFTSSNTVKRKLEATWNCCDGIKKTQIKHSTPPQFPLFPF